MTNNAASAAAKIAGELGELDVETFEVKDYLDYTETVFGSTCSSSSPPSGSSCGCGAARCAGATTRTTTSTSRPCSSPRASEGNPLGAVGAAP